MPQNSSSHYQQLYVLHSKGSRGALLKFNSIIRHSAVQKKELSSGKFYTSFFLPSVLLPQARWHLGPRGPWVSSLVFVFPPLWFILSSFCFSLIFSLLCQWCKIASIKRHSIEPHGKIYSVIFYIYHMPSQQQPRHILTSWLWDTWQMASLGHDWLELWDSIYFLLILNCYPNYIYLK